MNYLEAAEEAKAGNPDGWYVDPEAMLALSEHAWEKEHFDGVPQIETYRAAWKHQKAIWVATGSISAAAEMVAIEKEVAA